MSERSPIVFSGVVVAGVAFAIGKAWWNRTSASTRRQIRDLGGEYMPIGVVIALFVLGVVVIESLVRSGLIDTSSSAREQRRGIVVKLGDILALLAVSFLCSYWFTALYETRTDNRNRFRWKVETDEEPFVPLFFGFVWLLGPVVYSSWARTSQGKFKAIMLGYTLPPLVFVTAGMTGLFE
jgi:hypothetical protein